MREKEREREREKDKEQRQDKGEIRGNRRRESRAKEGTLSLVAEMSQRHHLLTGAGLQAGF